MKKEYRSPEAEKLALEDGDLELVTGGTGEESYGEGLDGAPGEDGGGDAASGDTRRRPPNRPGARTFAAGRNSGCI